MPLMGVVSAFTLGFPSDPATLRERIEQEHSEADMDENLARMQCFRIHSTGFGGYLSETLGAGGNLTHSAGPFFAHLGQYVGSTAL